MADDRVASFVASVGRWWSPAVPFDAPREARDVAAKLSAGGREHLFAARSARDQRLSGSAVTLYGKAIAAFASAKSLLEAGKAASEKTSAAPEAPASLDPGDVVQSCSASWMTAERKTDAIAILGDPQAVRGLTWGRRRRALAGLERLAGNLGREVYPCADRELTIVRMKRQLGVALLIAAIVALLVAWKRAPHNVARGKPVTASSVRMGTPQALTNGAIEWGTFGFHSNPSGREWAMVDLKKFYALDSVEVYSRGEGRFDFNLPLSVETSADGVSFQPAGACTDVFTQATPCVVELHRVRARYVRVSAPEVVLSEIEVYGR
ncbi:MAG: discoidin domain-containing protein [Polyangiaceae bacterium]